MISVAINTKGLKCTLSLDCTIQEFLTTYSKIVFNEPFQLSFPYETFGQYDDAADFILEEVNNFYFLTYYVNDLPYVINNKTIAGLADKLDYYGILKDKIVRFEYNGGTKYGGVRVVQVTEVFDDRLTGVDLVKSESRSYLFSKIKRFPQVIQ